MDIFEKKELRTETNKLLELAETKANADISIIVFSCKEINVDDIIQAIKDGNGEYFSDYISVYAEEIAEDESYFEAFLDGAMSLEKPLSIVAVNLN